MVIDRENKIAYLAHPTNADEVKQAQSEGFEIIDIIFCPAGLTAQDAHTRTETRQKGRGRGKGDVITQTAEEWVKPLGERAADGAE